MRGLHFLLLGLMIFAAGCQTVPYTGRSQLLLTTEGEEMQMGEKAWKEIQEKEKVTTQQKYIDAVERVGKHISEAAQRPDFYWEFRVFESKQANAFCLPGGKIAVYTGLFKYAANDAELAAVMGHEVAHALARHGGERVSQGMVVQLGAEALNAAEVSEGWMMAYGYGAQLGAILPFSRTHELEADEIGFDLMAKAGYNPEAAISFWEKFGSDAGGEIAELFSTHPMGSKRQKALREKLHKANLIYQNAPVKRNIGVVYE